MQQPVPKASRKSKPNYINSILMISLVLFLLGLMGVFLLYTNMAGESLKESLRLSAYLKDDVNEVEMLQLRKKIEGEPYVKMTEYISKEEAAKQFLDEGNEDIEAILGDYNPLPASIEIGLQANYVKADSLEKIERALLDYPEIKLVKAQQILVNTINEQFKTIGLVLGAVSLLFFLIVITLIDNAIRLAMYSNRFVIRSMQLVGATNWFIIKPYMQRAAINGLIGGVIAVAALLGVSYFIQNQFEELKLVQEYYKFAILFILIILTGIFISWISSYRSVSKYLRMKLDELY